MIVSVDELRTYMSEITLTPDQRTAARLVIEGVQSEIETYLNRSIEPVTRSEYLVSDHNGNVWPLHTPIVSVVSVTHANAPLPFTLDDGLLAAGSPGSAVVLTYVGGIGEGHRAHYHLRLEVLRIAMREMQTRHDDTLSVKDLNTTDTTPLPIGLTEDDLKRIRRWKRRTIA